MQSTSWRFLRNGAQTPGRLPSDPSSLRHRRPDPPTSPFPLVQVSKLPAPFALRLKSLGRLAAPGELSPFHTVLKSRAGVHTR